MNTPMLLCSDDRRRMRLGENGECKFNGIEYVEAIPPQERGAATLRVHFQEVLKCVPTANAWRIEGGRRSDTLKVTAPKNAASGTASNTVTLTVEGDVDNSRYRLILTDPKSCDVDPHFSTYEFRFPSTTSGSDLDDLDESQCPPRQFPTPQIDYLARDYGRLRRLLFDRLSVTMPDWRERHVPDIGVMLIELFAYVGDHLSYQQDAIATEAYLGTARQRISVRRHARLVDYRLHEGCNARTFLHINAPSGDELDPADVVFIAGLPPGDTDPPEAVSLVELAQREILPLVDFEACQLPELDPWLKPSDVKDPLAFLQQMANDVQGCLATLWQCLPDSVSVRVLQELYNTAVETFEPLVKEVLDHLNVVLCQVWLANQVDPHEAKCCSEPTRRRIAVTSPHQCPASTNRAILEDLFPDLIVRRVTRGDKIRLFAGHNEIRFYTWDGSRCWLPRGTTSATLRDAYVRSMRAGETYTRVLQNLHVGDLLLLEEVRGSRTGQIEDADPLHRQVVRLTQVTHKKDPLVEVTRPDGQRDNLPIVEIEWHPDDALTFPLCLSARGRSTSDCHLVEDVSVARGNMILVDQGRTEVGELLDCMPGYEHHDPCADPHCCGTCSSESPPQLAPRPYRPQLKEPDLTFAQPLTWPERDKVAQRPMAASAMLTQQQHKAEPQLSLRGITPSPDVPESEVCVKNFSIDRLLQQLRVSPLDLCRTVAHLLPGKRCREVAGVPAWIPSSEREQALLQRLQRDIEAAITWEARNDLIDTPPETRQFTLEIDDQRRTHLRFPESGPNKPLPGSKFWATYRTGNGSSGNVGAGGITHIGFRKESLTGRGLSVRNPLPAVGGTDPESVASARLIAPLVTRKLKRAVTADDYALVVLQEFSNEVQGAKAQLIPGPLGQRVRVALDPYDRVENFEELRGTVQRELKRFQRIGHDVQVVLATEVPIDLTIKVRTLPGYLFEHVRAELLRTFNSGVHPDGLLGFFHPDVRTFGQGIFVSEIIAAARLVTGVRGVNVETLQRRGVVSQQAIIEGVLTLGPLEVAVLQRSSHRTSGTLTITDDKVTEARP